MEMELIATLQCVIPANNVKGETCCRALRRQLHHMLQRQSSKAQNQQNLSLWWTTMFQIWMLLQRRYIFEMCFTHIISQTIITVLRRAPNVSVTVVSHQI